MKQLRVAALVLAAGFSLIACGGSTPEPETPAKAETKAESSESAMDDDEFWEQEAEKDKANEASADEGAAAEDGAPTEGEPSEEAEPEEADTEE